MIEQLQLELAGSYWQVLLAGLMAIIKLAYCSTALVAQLVKSI